MTQVDETTLRSLYLPPYVAALENGAQSIMVSFSSWGGMNMHAQRHLITDVLKDELGFSGFVVTDWAGINLISDNYYTAVVTGINAGIDMVMVPQEYQAFILTLYSALENGHVSMERIDDAVSRILRVKFEMGLFEHPFSDETLLPNVGSDEHRALAREAVSQSLVLLKNEDETLPITTDDQTIFVAGPAAQDIGIQSGGWTIEWQGGLGAITPGTTILDGLEAVVPEGIDLHYAAFGHFEDETDAAGDPLIADVGIVVMGEAPYAEWFGDSGTLSLSQSDVATVARMREMSERLVIVLLSGRPVIMTDLLPQADAVVAAWLPGTEGAGVADVLFGIKPFTGRLSYTWPRSVDQLPFEFANLPSAGCDAPLFPYDYGLTYEDSTSSWLELAAECSAE